jgi:hypothetical protein
MTLDNLVGEVEGAGVILQLEGEKVLVLYPDNERREKLIKQIASLRAHRAEVAEYLKTRTEIPPMPPGVRLVSWKLRDPPWF